MRLKAARTHANQGKKNKKNDSFVRFESPQPQLIHYSIVTTYVPRNAACDVAQDQADDLWQWRHDALGPSYLMALHVAELWRQQNSTKYCGARVNKVDWEEDNLLTIAYSTSELSIQKCH
jgi:hypothetical protein